MNITRRSFSHVLFGGAGLATMGLGNNLQSPRESGAPVQDGAPDWPGFPHQSTDLARTMVGVAHGDFAKVKELVAAHPALANAAWDWGFGDWETALGAASHMGRRDIAEFLIDQGARIDIFAATMLGHTEAVKTLVTAHPGIQRTKGPHGIPMLAHATAGGPPAAEVAAFLTSLGDAGLTYANAALSAEELAMYPGVYAYGADPDLRFSILVKRDQLAFQKGDAAPRFLFNLGERRFHPAGAPGVRLIFEITQNADPRLVISDHDLKVAAARVAAQ